MAEEVGLLQKTENEMTSMHEDSLQEKDLNSLL